MYQQVRKPKAVGPQQHWRGAARQIAALLTAAVTVAFFIVAGCGDEEIEANPAAEAATTTPAVVTGTVETTNQLAKDKAAIRGQAQIRDAADTSSLAGTTDTRPGAGFKLSYSKGNGAD
jgi:hypothetical protein